jgi:hypothetical protein
MHEDIYHFKIFYIVVPSGEYTFVILWILFLVRAMFTTYSIYFYYVANHVL